MPISAEQRKVLLETLETIKWHEAHNVMSYKCDDPWAAFAADNKRHPSIVPGFDKVKHREDQCKALLKLLYEKGLLAERMPSD